MWSSIMLPQGHSSLPANSPAKQQQQRDFGILAPTLPIATGKSFTNPNFVNKFDKYRTIVQPVDSATKNYQNSCHHSHIIDSIKERCPEVIPSVEEDARTLPESSPEFPAMCLGNKTTKSLKREHNLQKRKRPSGKHSKQNQKRQEIQAMLQEEDAQDTLNNSATDICPDPKIPTLHLKDFIMRNPSLTVCSLIKGMVQSIEIPISNSEMVLTITNSPSRSRQYSVTDSEDSFIIFDHEGNEKHVAEGDNENTVDKESHCNRLRKPSVCESEDSFILFEHVETASQDDEADYCFDGSDEENVQDSESDFDSDFDDTDSSFSIVQPKKVRFASDTKLCEVHPMIKWSYAYQAARKGPWEMYARDRCRFRERANRVERELKHVFNPQHREKIYKERFENL